MPDITEEQATYQINDPLTKLIATSNSLVREFERVLSEHRIVDEHAQETIDKASALLRVVKQPTNNTKIPRSV